MRRTLRDLADARRELLEIQQEFVRLHKRINAVRDCAADSLVRLFGEERPAFTGLQEEAFMERVAERVVARLKARPNAQVQEERRYVREKEAAAFLGVSVFTLQRGRLQGYQSPDSTGWCCIPRIGMERYLKRQTVERSKGSRRTE